MGENLGRLLLHESLKASVELPSGFSLSELTVPALIAGKTLAELQIRQTHRLNVIAVNHEGQWTEATPQLVLEANDVLLIAGRSEQMERLASLWDV
jgi:trk system potassium uptake protein TrkA